MKRFIIRHLSLVLALCVLLTCLASCKETPATDDTPIDYAASVTLDMQSGTLKQEVTVKTYVDGDTTHFYVPETVSDTGVLKARYLAINTPESTGKIEEYGKKASAFTRAALSSASSVIIESDDGNWNLDSTGGRHLVWVWYRTSEAEPYRNLNIEILQNGLAIASSAANNRYGETCVAAIASAKARKLNLYSGEKDPDFFYGEAVELTLKELRLHPEEYNQVKVAFEGVITKNYDNSVYIEEYDPDSYMYYGMAIYYGFSQSGELLDNLAVGNRTRVVGTVSYYEAGGTYQVSGLSYRVMKPDDPNNTQKLGEGFSPAFVPVSAKTFTEGKVLVEKDEEMVEYPFAELAMNTSVSMEDLTVRSVYTTSSKESSNYGAMTLVCEAEGKTVTVRTVPLYDENKNLITEEMYLGERINVRGLVDLFDGEYQIKVFREKDIEIR